MGEEVVAFLTESDEKRRFKRQLEPSVQRSDIQLIARRYYSR